MIWKLSLLTTITSPAIHEKLFTGRVLPQAIIGLLVIYCLKDISLLKHPYGAPELIAGAFVVVLQAWKRNAVLSILAGTIVYMILIRVIV